jgi:phosphohistidine swiveling domain-containing protein
MTSPPHTYLLEIADEPRVGGKARSLARLRQAGLPTPDGFVIAHSLFATLLPPGSVGAAARPASSGQPRDLPGEAPPGGGGVPVGGDRDGGASVENAALPAGFSEALAARVAALGGELFSVRSSFAGEDDVGSVAAGIYRSRTGVPAAEVERAVRQVLASALAPAAVAYARARGRGVAEPPVCVLVHRFYAGGVSGGAAWDPDAPEQGPVIDAVDGEPSPPVRATLQAALRTLASRHGSVEIEWVADGDAVTFLQMRPYRAPSPARPWPGQDELPAGTPWQWDAAHNPLPLTPAQAGLVALVDAQGGTAFRQHVARGYLFWSPTDRPSAPSSALDQLGPQIGHAVDPVGPEITAGVDQLGPEIEREVGRIRRDVERALAGLGDPPDLERALDAFVGFYPRIFGALRSAMDRARTALVDFLRRHRPVGSAGVSSMLGVLLAEVPSMAQERRRAAEQIARATDPEARHRAVDAYLARFGDESAVWDVAAPTHRERPQLVSDRLVRSSLNDGPRPDWQAAAEQVRAGLPDALQQRWQATLTSARAAAAAGEDDDWIYARLQAAVRRALLHLGRQLVAAGRLDQVDDVFYLPPDRVWLPRPPTPGAASAREGDALRALAAAGRAAHGAALRDPPPPSRPGSLARAAGSVLRGSGTGGRALGRVHRHDPAGQPPPADAILVATTLLPTELPLLQVAALVTETGGPLGHVATQARERAVPAVVGVAGALDHLEPGDLVLVDADAGVVILCMSEATDPPVDP